MPSMRAMACRAPTRRRAGFPPAPSCRKLGWPRPRALCSSQGLTAPIFRYCRSQVPSWVQPAARSATPRKAGRIERTRHARTFHHGPGLLELPVPDHPLADPDDPKVKHTFSRNEGRIHVETRTSHNVYQVVVEYAFGTRDRYVTMVGRDDERTFRALRLSSYHAGGSVLWDRTSGDVPESGGNEDVRGQRIQVRDGIVRCVYCHVTEFSQFREQRASLAAADAGIGCERCHGPGGNHLAAISAGFADAAIVNAGTASAASIVAQCADCHIVGLPADIRRAPDDPAFVRSSGLTLTFSRCYTESDGGMSCLTCHDPHRDDEGTAAFYEAKCLACHSQQPRPENEIHPPDGVPAAPPSSRPSVCRVNPAKNCLDCHMPKVAVDSLHTSLTDHYIRVRR